MQKSTLVKHLIIIGLLSSPTLSLAYECPLGDAGEGEGFQAAILSSDSAKVTCIVTPRYGSSSTATATSIQTAPEGKIFTPVNSDQWRPIDGKLQCAGGTKPEDAQRCAWNSIDAPQAVPPVIGGITSSTCANTGLSVSLSKYKVDGPTSSSINIYVKLPSNSPWSLGAPSLKIDYRNGGTIKKPALIEVISNDVKSSTLKGSFPNQDASASSLELFTIVQLQQKDAAGKITTLTCPLGPNSDTNPYVIYMPLDAGAFIQTLGTTINTQTDPKTLPIQNNISPVYLSPPGQEQTSG